MHRLCRIDLDFDTVDSDLHGHRLAVCDAGFETVWIDKMMTTHEFVTVMFVALVLSCAVLLGTTGWQVAGELADMAGPRAVLTFSSQ